MWTSSGWNDARILRRLLPPAQPTGAARETSLKLPMQEGYIHMLLEHARFCGQPWGGILLESTDLRVSSFRSCTAASETSGYPSDHGRAAQLTVIAL